MDSGLKKERRKTAFIPAGERSIKKGEGPVKEKER
jgi:hypothetical protein